MNIHYFVWKLLSTIYKLSFIQSRKWQLSFCQIQTISLLAQHWSITQTHIFMEVKKCTEKSVTCHCQRQESHQTPCHHCGKGLEQLQSAVAAWSAGLLDLPGSCYWRTGADPVTVEVEVIRNHSQQSGDQGCIQHLLLLLVHPDLLLELYLEFGQIVVAPPWNFNKK